MKDPTRTCPALIASTIFVVMAAWVPCASAHHSSAMYDDHRSVTVAGTVTKFDWANPHVYIYIEQSAGAGQTIQWEIEASPPSILRRLGWSQETLHPGDRITVSGRPAKVSSKKSLIPITIQRGSVTLFNREGEVKQLESAASSSSHPVKGFDGTWVTLLAPKLEERLDAENLSLTAKGAAAFKSFDEKKMHPGIDCVPNPAPVLMLTPDLKRITTAGKVILIEGEFDGAQRTIHMDVSSHEGAAASVQGHSIGRWDGTSLVIDTTQFAYHWLGNAYGLPSGARKHLLERLTPAADGASLTYHFELTDPEFLAAPVAGDVRWLYRPALKYAPEKCNPENARRFTRQ